MAFNYEKFLAKKEQEKKHFDKNIKIEKPILLSRKRTRTRLAGGNFKDYYCAETVRT